MRFSALDVTRSSKINIEIMNEGSSILREINKNTSSDNFKSKKHKFGHGAKRQEENLLCGMSENLQTINLACQ